MELARLGAHGERERLWDTKPCRQLWVRELDDVIRKAPRDGVRFSGNHGSTVAAVQGAEVHPP